MQYSLKKISNFPAYSLSTACFAAEKNFEVPHMHAPQKQKPNFQKYIQYRV